jgi:Zn-dependent peptidase ImmA (M78 family)
MSQDRRDEIWQMAIKVRHYLGIGGVIGFDELTETLLKHFKGSKITIVDTIDNTTFTNAKITKKKKTFKIKLQYEQIANKQLFNLVHALGHLFIHMGYKNKDKTLWKNASVYYDKFGIGEKVQEANEFAKAFLMPKFDFIEQVKWKLDNNTNIVDTNSMAKYFNVSEQDIIVRGRDLKVFKY